MAAFKAVGDHTRVKAEKRSVEGEDALDMREHEVGGCRVGAESDLDRDVPEVLERVVLEGKLGVSGFVAEVEVQ